MKRLLVMAFAILTTIGSAMATDTPIQMNELPTVAQQFVKKYFAKSEVSRITKDVELGGTDYKVTFADGSKVEFDNKGNWSDVECLGSEVPAGVVPVVIVNAVKERQPGAKIITIDKDNTDYELQLNNGKEMKFDLKGKFLRYDD